MNLRFIALSCALLSLSIVTSASAMNFPTPEPPRPGADEREQLEGGDILASARQSGDEIRLEVLGVIDAPIDEVWEIVRDFGTTSEWVPDMERSDVVERSEGRMVADAVTAIPLLRNRSYRLDIRVVRVRNGAFASHWHNVEGHGNINSMRGFWWLEPWGNSGERTLARQVSWMDLGIPIPSGMVRRSAQRELPATLEALRERHRSTYR